MFGRGEVLRKKLLFTLLTTMFLMLSTGFAQLPGQKPGPLVDELRTIAIVDPSAAIAALKAGEIDVVGVPSLADLQDLQALGYKVVQLSYYNHLEFTLNFHRTPLDDIDFRRAIAHLTPKEAILEELWGQMGKYSYNWVDPTWRQWYNPNIPDVTTYDPELAKLILDDAGYKDKNMDGWREYPNGTQLQELAIVTCRENSAAAIALCERLVDEMHKVGIPARLEYTYWAGGAWYTRIYTDHDFDLWEWWWGWGPDPIILELNFASYGSLNGGYYNNTEFDQYLYTCLHTLNETEAVDASNKMQEILANDVPSIPLLESINTMAVNPNVLGFASLPYYGGMMGFLRHRWKTGPGGTIRFIAEEPGSLIPGWDWGGGTYWTTWWTCDSTIEADIAGNLVPWTVADWKVEPWSDSGLGVVTGSKITLTVADGLYWHDGVKFTAYDLEFAAEYARDYQAPRMSDIITDLVDAKALNEKQVELYYNRTSIFLVRFLSSPYFSAFPKHIYNPNATKYGEPEGPMGLQSEGVPGVPDPSTFVPALKPHPNPPADLPWLTCYIGVGPYIFKSYEFGVGGTFVANRNYTRTILVTDISFDRKVNILDIAGAAKAFGKNVGNPGWNLLCDFDGNNKINIVDLAVIALDFGKKY
jgi:ABC-type transport system substrate-binding protein